MAWVRLDDSFYDHHKFDKAGPLGLALWVTGLAYCNRNLTDGFISRAAARRLIDFEGVAWRCWMGEMSGGGEDAEPDDVAAHLVACGLWETAEGGYMVHDYLDYQPSAEQVRGERAKVAERVNKWRRRHAQSSNEEGNVVRNGVTNGVSDGVSTDAPTPTPTPSSVVEVSDHPHLGDARANDPLTTALTRVDLQAVRRSIGGNCDAKWAIKVSRQVLGASPEPTKIRDPTKYVLRSITENPENYRPTWTPETMLACSLCGRFHDDVCPPAAEPPSDEEVLEAMEARIVERKARRERSEASA